MNDERARLSTTIPIALDGELRVFCAERRLPMSVVVSVFTRFGLDRTNDRELSDALEAAAEELKELRAERGRDAMDKRYGKDSSQ